MKAGKDPQLQILQIKEGELEGFLGFLWPWERPIGFVGAHADFGVLLVLMGLFLSLLSLSLLFSGKKTHTSLLVTASHLVLELLPFAPGDHVTCASLPEVPSAFFSSVLLLLQPQEHLLTRVVAAGVTGREGTCRGKAFSCSRERANISGWGEARQESSGRGLWRLNLEG